MGELPLPAQVKLNRALQEKEIRRVGDNAVDARWTCASSPPPTATSREEIRAGRFREDLFYRLHVFPVTMPPLRERPRTCPLLASHFLEKHAHALRRELAGFEPRGARSGWPPIPGPGTFASWRTRSSGRWR